jgi:hypothetical protein
VCVNVRDRGGIKDTLSGGSCRPSRPSKAAGSRQQVTAVETRITCMFVSSGSGGGHGGGDGGGEGVGGGGGGGEGGRDCGGGEGCYEAAARTVEAAMEAEKMAAVKVVVGVRMVAAKRVEAVR